MFYWVTLVSPIRFRGADRKAFSVDADTEALARTVVSGMFGDGPGATVASVQALPCPGEPRLNYKSGSCPSFCMHPAKCAGRTSCPRSLACSE